MLAQTEMTLEQMQDKERATERQLIIALREALDAVLNDVENDLQIVEEELKLGLSLNGYRRGIRAGITEKRKNG